MRPFFEYEVIIFDCDGVILNSNQLKIDAMRLTLSERGFSEELVELCVNYFSNNFGKSRFHHVEHFLDVFINPDPRDRERLRQSILAAFSEKCKELYLGADLTLGVVEFLEKSSARKYVASGSEQEELRDVFKRRGLSKYFCEVFGSPQKKVEHVKYIASTNKDVEVVMIGDALSDIEAAMAGEVDFVFYSPYSNVFSEMQAKCVECGSRVICSFEELLIEI